MKGQSGKQKEKTMGIDKGVISKVVIGVIAVGAVYALGVSQGAKVGRRRGILEGYVRATTELTSLIRHSSDIINME